MAVSPLLPPSSAKQRQRLIDLLYLRRGDRITRVKRAAAVAGAVVAAVYTVFCLSGAPQGAKELQPGPVAAAHQAWEAKCETCHLSGVAQGPASAQWLGLWTGVGSAGGGVRPTADTLRRLADEQCRACHLGPAHHFREIPGEAPTCAACHLDHRGRSAELVRAHDALCTTCHADLTTHLTGPPTLPPPLANVTNFAADHPDFRSLGRFPEPAPAADPDPGALKFNHALHLFPGQASPGNRGAKRLADLPPEWRERYRRDGQGDQELVRLDCDSCHRTTAEGRAGDREAVLAARDGAYMLPIRYEAHCRACHPLELQAEPADSAPRSVPHGVSGERMAAFLDGLLVERIERRRASEPAPGEGEPATPDAQPAPPAAAPSDPVEEPAEGLPLIPGRRLGGNLAAQLRADVELARENDVLKLALECRRCHFPAPAADEAGGATAGSAARLAMLPPQLPAIWLQHARFDHAAHRMVKCQDCHPDAYAPPPADSQGGLVDSQRVMIAGYESCVRCHSPGGGVRHDCAGCHRYHAADDPLPSRGAPARGARERSFAPPAPSPAASPTSAREERDAPAQR